MKLADRFFCEVLDFYATERVQTSLEDDCAYIDIGPTQHGITRGERIYFFDPAGNRNEVFAGGYSSYPDRPTHIWTPDQLGKGIFYVQRVT